MHGVEFTFLKFRSMYVANDSKIHREFTQSLIRGDSESKTGFYKIQKDPESHRSVAFSDPAAWMNCRSFSTS